MSNETHKADQIAFHFYTKLFYVVNHARATEEPRVQSKVDKWFNLETPDSELFTKEAREPYKSISLAPPPGPPPLEIQVLLSIPEVMHNQVLVYMSPDSSRVRIEPIPRFILLESWILTFSPRRRDRQDASMDVALPTIYKHGIPLFRSLFSLLRVLPVWKLYKRLKRRTGGVVRNGNLGIQLRVRSISDSENDDSIMQFHTIPSRTARTPFPTETHTFPAVPHPLGSLSLSATYLSTPNFQLDELESLLSSRFISQDLGAGEGFVPTLTKNQQRDSITGSSMPTSFARSPPRAIGRPGKDNISVADRFILPTRTASIPGGPSSLGANDGAGSVLPSRLQSNFESLSSLPPSGLAITRLRRESLNSSQSSSISGRELPSAPFLNPAASSVLSSSPVSGQLAIRRPNVNPVHPFKSNTLSSASGSSPSLSIRQTPAGGGSPLSTTGVPSSLSGATSSHTRQPSVPQSAVRLPPSPIGSRPSPPFAPSSLGDRRSGTSGSGERDRRVSVTSVGGDGGEERPPRKRYSSSFGHRYIGSVGSVNSGEGAGSIGSGYGLTAGVAVGHDRRERKHSAVGSVASFLSTATDDDDISIFVQDIDSAKPLSGRTKERESRHEDRKTLQYAGQGEDSSQGHDRDKDELTMKPKAREQHVALPTAPPPPGTSSRDPWRPILSSVVPAEPQASSSPPGLGLLSTSPTSALLSVSPTRGPMLTSQSEVDERLRRMNENFMKSLEGISSGASGNQRRKARDRERAQHEESESAGLSEVDEPTRQRNIAHGGRTVPRDVHSRRSTSSLSSRTHPIQRIERYSSMGVLGQSVTASQGSQEVIGRLELDDEKARRRYQP